MSRRTRLLILLLPAALSCGFGSCSLSMPDVCQVHLPEFERHVAAISGALEQNRAVASDGEDWAEARQEWMNWAEKSLKATQHFMDTADDSPELVEAGPILTAIANDLVSFYGYAEQGHRPRMRGALAKVKDRAEQFRKMACSQ